MNQAKYRDLVASIVSLGVLLATGLPMGFAQQDGIETDRAGEFESAGTSGGVEDVFDSMDAQVEAAEADGGEAPDVSKRSLDRIEEIVVSARKRTEALEDTPISVTALGSATLKEAGVERLDQIQNLVPNLQIQTGINGYDATMIIRGVGQGDAEVTFDPGVGIYVDGVYLARAQGSVLSLIDTQQIEVLRGPQGTLFGKNTIGGAINLTTVKPAEELGAYAFVRTGSLGTIDTRFSLDLPIDIGWFEDKLFSRMTFASQNSRGYVYDHGNDIWLNDHNAVGFMGALRFLPTDDLTIDVTGSWFRDSNHARGGKCIPVRETTLTQTFLKTNQLDPSTDYSDQYFEDCAKTGPYDVNLDTYQIADIQSFGAWGTITYDIGEVGWLEDVQIKSITAWRGQQPRDRTDIDQGPFPVGLRAALGGDGTFDGGSSGPQPGLDGQPGDASQISEEVQATMTGWEGRFSGVVGAYGFWEDAFVQRGERYFPGILTRTGGGTTLTTINVDNWSWALFGQASVDPFEWLGITAGLRYSEEKKGYSQLKAIPDYDGIEFAPLVGSRDPETGALSPATGTAKYSAWTPMASLALRLPDSLLLETELDSLMGYFTFSRGFKSGGFNGGARSNAPTQLQPFDPETLDNFELGSKLIAFQQRLTLNLSLFLGSYDEIQVRTIVPLPCPPGCVVPPTDLIIENAATATTKGVEMEFVALPIDGLRIQGSVGLLDAKFDSFPDAASDLYEGVRVDRSGESFPGAPKVQTHLGVQYSFEFDPGTDFMAGWITPRLDWSYQSAVHYFSEELVEAEQRGYNLLNLRLSYDFLDDRAQFALWGRNVLGTRYFNAATPVASTMGTVLQFFGPPASGGAEFSYRF